MKKKFQKLVAKITIVFFAVMMTLTFVSCGKKAFVGHVYECKLKYGKSIIVDFSSKEATATLLTSTGIEEKKETYTFKVLKREDGSLVVTLYDEYGKEDGKCFFNKDASSFIDDDDDTYTRIK